MESKIFSVIVQRFVLPNQFTSRMKTGGGKGIKKEMDKEERRIRQKKDNY